MYVFTCNYIISLSLSCPVPILFAKELVAFTFAQGDACKVDILYHGRSLLAVG